MLGGLGVPGHEDDAEEEDSERPEEEDAEGEEGCRRSAPRRAFAAEEAPKATPKKKK